MMSFVFWAVLVMKMSKDPTIISRVVDCLDCLLKTILETLVVVRCLCSDDGVGSRVAEQAQYLAMGAESVPQRPHPSAKLLQPVQE